MSFNTVIKEEKKKVIPHVEEKLNSWISHLEKSLLGNVLCNLFI